MSDMWNKFTAGAKSAGDAVQKSAEKSKLQAENLLLKQKVTGAKKEMGLQIYDAMVLGDQNEVSRVFAQFKAQVDELEAKIREKNGRIEQLDQV
mmetsp:Transcript_20689/g.61718  ORF Transcript_20689/g.61718 Transcript_20689/m.61718 type:complete len:94 (+) Transcript_20689:118-399(+)|eukprot:CAMPEP_0119260060 /NCGR_PEP_ID=MMETSP1329-20130426/628_1 /TAXON_ID=114041 /ORGANISM="Genus nov. species nov., Strain RCC1024" /LENGTH=93 /DNA_ID=CAMNT_0007259475 /DNA_START=100 /DNA_END=381 /DNA_ORIENTATION=-